MPAYLGSTGEVRIGTCNLGTDAALSADVWFDEYNNARGNAHFIINTLNLSESAFELHMNREGYKSNHIVLTVPNNITMSNIINCQVGTWNLESLDNSDGTMSVKMIGKNYAASCFYVTDSSGNTVYEGVSWDELLNKFKLYGNKAETFFGKLFK